MKRRSDYRDAVALLYATVDHDEAGKRLVLLESNPVYLIEAIVDMHLGLAYLTTDGHVREYVDAVRDNLDANCDALGIKEDL